MPSEHAPSQLVTFVVPDSSLEPTEVRVHHSGLKIVLVSRESIALLDDAWKKLGVYFLLGPTNDPDRYAAYVGEVGKSTLVQRIKQHADKKEWWNRALLIRSASDEFDSAEIGWLEGRLYDVLNNAVACDLKNGNRPEDSSPTAEMQALPERYVGPIMAALRSVGASHDTVDQKPQPKGKKKSTRYSESVSDLLAAGLLKPDTVLQPLRKNVVQTARVLADGNLEVNGTTHTSLSGAAKAAAGTAAEPGWDFWGAPSGTGGLVPLKELRDRLREETNGKPTAPKSKPPRQPTAPSAPAAPRQPVLAPVVAAQPELFPLALFADYRGVHIEASVDHDGRVHFDGATYTSPSMAAVAARQQHGYAGAGKAQTNGWTFWRYVDGDGTTKPLDALRKQLT